MPHTIPEWEEHAHIGGVDNAFAFKTIYSVPVAYKGFPSLASGYTYHAVAPVGSASGASVWRVMRQEKTTDTITYADGDSNFDNALNDVTALTYS